jgi:hypothetical protein
MSTISEKRKNWTAEQWSTWEEKRPNKKKQLEGIARNVTAQIVMDMLENTTLEIGYVAKQK